MGWQLRPQAANPQYYKELSAPLSSNAVKKAGNSTGLADNPDPAGSLALADLDHAADRDPGCLVDRGPAGFVGPFDPDCPVDIADLDCLVDRDLAGLVGPADLDCLVDRDPAGIAGATGPADLVEKGSAGSDPDSIDCLAGRNLDLTYKTISFNLV